MAHHVRALLYGSRISAKFLWHESTSSATEMLLLKYGVFCILFPSSLAFIAIFSWIESTSQEPNL